MDSVEKVPRHRDLPVLQEVENPIGLPARCGCLGPRGRPDVEKGALNILSCATCGHGESFFQIRTLQPFHVVCSLDRRSRRIRSTSSANEGSRAIFCVMREQA